MKQLIRKFASLALAAAMVVTMTPSSVMAGETEAPVLYRADLAQTEHGSIVFEDGSYSKDFAAETQVSVGTASEEGYKLDALNVVNTETRAKVELVYLEQPDTGVLTFSMPAQNITVSANFSQIPVETEAPAEALPTENVEEAVVPVQETPEQAPETPVIPEEQPSEIPAPVEAPSPESQPEPTPAEPTPAENAEVPANPPVEQEPVAEKPAQADAVPESEAVVTEEQASFGTVGVRVFGDGGQVVLNGDDGQYTVVSSNGQKTMTNPDGSVVYADTESGYDFAIVKEAGTVMSVSVVPEEGYKVAEYRFITDSGDGQMTETALLPDAASNITFNGNVSALEVRFAEKGLYDIEGYDYSAFEGLDFSGKQLIVSSDSAEVFVDGSAVVSQYGNIYILRFEDAETTMKAYAYYLGKVNFVEIDPVSEEDIFQVALIDTGANGATKSVSMIGSDVADNSGHGSQMLAHVLEQNPNATVLSIKALSSEGYGSASDIAAAIRYASSKNVSIILMPMSAPVSADDGNVSAAIMEAVAKGITVVGPAGNNGQDASAYIPASVDAAMIIGSANEDGELNFNSNFGTTVDYNVVAVDTSSASAIFAGWVSVNGLEAIDGVLNQGLIFSTDYIKEETPSEEKNAENVPSDEQPEDVQPTETTDTSSEIQENNPENEAVSYQDYIAENTDEELAGKSEPVPCDRLIIKHTFANKALMPENDYTINGLFRDDDNDGVSDYLGAFLGQTIDTITLYTTEDSDYMFGYVDTLNAENTEVVDSIVAVNNDYGMTLEGWSYDAEAGMVYIPKGYMTQSDVAVIEDRPVSLQMQLLYVTDNGFNGITSKINVIISDLEGNEIVNGFVEDNIYNNSVAIKLTDEEGNRIFNGFIQKVTVNGLPVQNYGYDDLSGNLIINDVTASAVDVVEIVAGEIPSDEEGTQFTATAGTYVFNGGGKLKVDGDASQGATAQLSGTRVMYYKNNGGSPYQTTGLYQAAAGSAADNPYTAAAQAAIARKAISGGMISPSDVGSKSGHMTNYWNVYIPAGTYTFTNPKGEPVTVTIPEDVKSGLACTHVGISISGGKNYVFQEYLPGGTAAQHPYEVWGYIDINAAQPYQVSLNSSFQSYGAVTAAGMMDGYAWYNAPLSASIVAIDEANGVLYMAVAAATAGSQSGTGVLAIPFQPEAKKGGVSFSKSVMPAQNNLTVKKTVVDPTNSGKEFSFTLSYGPSQSYGNTETFTLSASNPSTSFALPAGWYYKIEEADYSSEGWETTVNSAAGRSVAGRMDPVPDSSFSFTVSGVDASTPWYIGNSQMGTVGQGITLKAGQTATLKDLKAGTKVTVTETAPGGNWSTGNRTLSGTVQENTTISLGSITNTYTPNEQTVSFRNELPKGFAVLKKASQASEWCTNNNLYSLAGAVYEVYSSSRLDAAHKVGSFTTDANGNTTAIELPVGTYYVIETKASPGHGIDPRAKSPNYLTVRVTKSNTASNPAVINSTDPVQNDPLVIKITKSGGEYSYKFPLEGVIFEVRYFDNVDGNISGTPNRTWKIKTIYNASRDAYEAALDDKWLVEGSSTLYKLNNSTRMPIGTYAIRELSTVTGYTLSRGQMWFNSDPNAKVDTETGTLIRVLKGENEAIDIDVNNESTGYNKPIEVDTEALGSTVGSDNNETHYMDASVNFGVVTDTITFQNLTVGSQYHVIGRMYDSTEGGRTLYGTVEDDFTAQQQDNGTYTMYFSVHGLKNLVGHDIVIGETLNQLIDGQWVTVAKETDLNQPKQTVHVIAIGTTLIDQATGDHVAKAGESVLIDKVAYTNLLPGDTFTLKGELYDKTTHEVVATGETTFTAETKNGVVDVPFNYTAEENHSYVALEKLYFNGHLITSHEDYNDEDQIVHVPEIHTSLKDVIDEERDALASTEITLVDTVHYKNLIPGKEYTVSGKLMNKKTEEPALDDNGNAITAETTFTPETATGTVDVTFTFSGVNLAGESVVAFETLKHNDVELTTHADITDKDQTVDLPKIGTTLRDTVDNDIDALAEEEIELVDTVSYENLIVGKKYTLKGTLMDKVTGEPALDDNGEKITGEAEFTAPAKDGVEYVTFRFSGVSLAGHDVVAFEQLYTETKMVAIHEDINDTDQTVEIPKVTTTLSDSIDNDIDSLAAVDMVLVDTVYYENLLPGREYTLHGVLMDKETGEPALDDEGNTIESETTFTPETADGAEDITFTFSGVNLAGHTVVAFERLYREEKLVGIHCDIDDFDQSNWIPKIGTTLKDTVDMDDDADATETMELVDTVAYHNLIPGRTYVMRGILMDQGAGIEAMDDEGNQIVGETFFTAEEANGTVDVIFTFSGVSLAGHTLVAFEDLFHVTYDADNPEEIVAEKKVATHQDITDVEQSVYVPKIETTLADTIDDEHDALAAEEIKLVDHVAYTNLIIGREYKVTGILMDQVTGEPALDDNGEEIKGETTFTAETTEGIADVEFTFSGVNLAGHTVVAFEDLFRGEKHLAVHADIDDTNQFVHIPEIETTLKDVIDEEHDAFATTDITLVDVVNYKNLLPGLEYVMKGTLMDKETGEPALDDAGQEITAEATFTPEEPDGSVEITFTFSGVNLAGRSVVAFEHLERNGKEVAVHTDITDENQTVDLPKIGTTLVSKEGLHTAYNEDKIVLTDTVAYENLHVGRTYTISGVLMDKATGKEVLNKDGKPVVSVQNFAPTEPNGTIDLTFTLDNVPEEGLITVAYETLTKVASNETPAETPSEETPATPDEGGEDTPVTPEEGREVVPGDDSETPDVAPVTPAVPKTDKIVAEHKDINDVAQTVAIPSIRTTLTGREELKTINMLNTVTLFDKIEYKNLMPGSTYTMKGVIVSKETGKAILDADGKEVRAEGTFTPEKPNGSVTLEFTFKAPEEFTPVMVAFEYLYENDIKVAQHEDINDEDQSVTAVRIRTIAEDEKGDKVFEAATNNKVLDTVEFAGLVPGKEYRLVGTLVSKTEKEADGKTPKQIAVGELKFKAEASSGKVVVEIQVPANTYIGEAVVFEELLDSVTGNTVCVHNDLTDEDQTVWFASVLTKATFKDGSKRAHLGQEQTIVDEVTYKGFKPGTEYVVTTYLMNKSTGKAITSLGKQVSATKEFTPEKTDGKVPVEIVVPKQTVKGEVVVFEVVKEKKTDKTIARHEDINDKEQTVEFYSNPKPNNTPKTGDPNNIWMFVGIGGGACILAALVLLLYNRKKKQNR